MEKKLGPFRREEFERAGSSPPRPPAPDPQRRAAHHGQRGTPGEGRGAPPAHLLPQHHEAQHACLRDLIPCLSFSFLASSVVNVIDTAQGT
jgi:hypothetical protein